MVVRLVVGLAMTVLAVAATVAGLAALGADIRLDGGRESITAVVADSPTRRLLDAGPRRPEAGQAPPEPPRAPIR